MVSSLACSVTMWSCEIVVFTLSWEVGVTGEGTHTHPYWEAGAGRTGGGNWWGGGREQRVENHMLPKVQQHQRVRRAGSAFDPVPDIDDSGVVHHVAQVDQGVIEVVMSLGRVRQNGVRQRGPNNLNAFKFCRCFRAPT